MELTSYEQELLDGGHGLGLQRAMELLVRYGNACGAQRFVPITSAHVMPKEPPELLEWFTEGMDDAPVMTTLHPRMSAFSPQKWEEMGIPEDFAQQEMESIEARDALHNRLGFFKTYSCLPMHMGNLPRRGDCISWIGSCAQILANSLLGARTNKDGTIVNLCAAVTGRAPEVGLFIPENRLARILVTLEDDVELTEDDDYGALGYYVGAQVDNKSVAFSGISKTTTFDQLKYMIAPAAASGSPHICHVIGITPEASTQEEAFGGKAPEEIITVSRKNIEDTKKLFDFDKEKPVDLVLLGCPHITIEELGTISRMLKGQRLVPGKRLWLALGNQTYALGEAMGYVQIIEAAGGVISNTCLATIPDSPLPEQVEVVATNSFKSAHYVKQLQLNRRTVMVGSLADCIGAITVREVEYGD